MISNATMGDVLTRLRDALKDDPPPVVTLIAHHQQDPFRVLVATILSLRTKDEVTAVAAGKILKRADTPKKMLSIPESEIAQLIYPVGFYKTKAKTLRTVSKLLIDEHGGKVPDDIDTLVTLPGVGRKTANLVLIEGYGKPAMCVDTHVHRISNRWGYVKTKTPDKTEMALREKLPKQHWLRYNELLVGFGQKICQPVSPKCSICPIRKMCPRMGVVKSR